MKHSIVSMRTGWWVGFAWAGVGLGPTSTVDFPFSVRVVKGVPFDVEIQDGLRVVLFIEFDDQAGRYLLPIPYGSLPQQSPSEKGEPEA